MDTKSTKLYNVLMGNPNYSGTVGSTNNYNNAIGRMSGLVNNVNSGLGGMFQKKFNSAENAIGTSLAAPASLIYDRMETVGAQSMLDRQRNSLDDIAKKYGYNTVNEFYDKYDEAKDAGDSAFTSQADKSGIWEELKSQAKSNADEATDRAKAYEDYRKNNYVSKKINQDNTKFLGSAINTMSTALDLTGLTANPLGNAVQGAVEGFADELEQNGGTIDLGRLEASNWDKFDLGRAGQNALIGAASGAVTGQLNKSLGKRLAQNGGNLFKGGNALTQGLNKLGSSTALGRGVSTIATGIGQGALSGAVGGATGAGISAALNNGNIAESILEGAKQGATQGAFTGGVMSGANMALSHTPGIGKFYNNLKNVKSDWENSGSNFDERLTNTLTSGDSAVGDWLMRKNSKVLGAIGNIGNRIQDVSDTYRTVDTLGNRREYTPDQVRQLIDEYENYKAPDVLSGNSTDEVTDAMGEAGVTLSEIFRNRNGGQFNPYSRADGEAFNEWVQQTKADLDTPTTAKGWAKRAGERIVEDVNDRGAGLSIKKVNSDMPEDIRNLKINNWNEDSTYQVEPAEEIVAPTQTRTQAVTQVDPWDQLAQESGYATYDDVVKSFMAANPNAEVNAGSVLTWMDNNQGTWNPNQRTAQAQAYTIDTEEELPAIFEPESQNQIQKRNKLQSVGEQLVNASKQQKYRALYDSLDAKTAQRAVETNAPETLAEMGIKPENYLEAAKTSNYVNKLVSDLAEDSNVRVNISDLPNRLEAAADDVTFAGTDAPNKFDRAIKQVVADGSTPDEFTASYLLEKSRDFGNKAARVKGTSDDAKALRTAYTNAKYILRDEAANALAQANITGDETNANVARGLAKMGANQKVIDYYTAPVDGKAPQVDDYIRRSSTFEQARDMGTQVAAEQLTRSASKQPTNLWTRMYRASGLDQPIELLLNNTVAPIAATATKLTGKAIKGVGDAGARLAGNNVTVADTTPVLDATYNPATNIYNAIGRSEGLITGEQERTANYLANAVQEANVAAQSAPNSLEGLVAPLGATTSSNSVYSSLYGQPTAATVAASQNTGYFQPTGDYWTDILATALTNAINNDDVDAFSSLYSMYQDALSNLQKQSGSSEQKLTATQQRANAAMNSLERLSQMTPDLGYNLSNIPLVGNIATWGGNNYEAEAKSLAQQIGYMVSGSNIKDSEAENIGKSYVPQPFDSEQVRQNKLRRAYEIIKQYQTGYAE